MDEAAKHDVPTEENDAPKNTARFTSSDRAPAISSSILSVYSSSTEASVRRTRNTNRASESVNNSSTFEISCDLCRTAGDVIEAVGYCSECHEYYCQPCYRAHSRSRATRDHTLQDQFTMPTICTPAASASYASINQGSEADDSQFNDEYLFNRDINIKYPTEKSNCYITGMSVVSDDELVVIDCGNRSAKLIDFGKDIITGFIKFHSDPYDITAIPNREVAIVFGTENIARILSTSDGLSVKRSLRLGGTCVAVHCCNAKLYVAYNEPLKFQILNMLGDVLKTIRPDSQCQQRCPYPVYISVHPKECKMYVSSWENNVVLCIDMSGAVVGLYDEQGLVDPYGICYTPFGSIYMCVEDQNAVYKMTEDLGEATVVLGKSDGIVLPVAVCFCENRKSLFVSSASSDDAFSNVIKIYKYA